MYAADYDSVTFTFEASGSLWKDAVVLMDRQSKSLWNQVYGRAIEGPYYGMELTLYPSEFITFKALKEKYPQAKLLAKEEKGGEGSYYEKYFKDPDRIGIFGRPYESDELGIKDTVLGLRLGAQTAALPIAGVEQRSAVKVDFTDHVAVVFYDPATAESFAFVIPREKAKTGKLALSQDGSLSYKGKSLSLEELGAGRAVEPDFERAALQISFWGPWKSFFPGTSITKF